MLKRTRVANLRIVLAAFVLRMFVIDMVFRRSCEARIADWDKSAYPRETQS